ncbi:hypothetical protein [Kaarinaea lacus]
MRNKLSGYTLAILELLALLQANTLWLAPFTVSATDAFSQTLQTVTGILSIILILLPLTGMFFIYREKRVGFVLLASFPLFCIIFGITAFPVVSYFYGTHVKLNSLFTAFTNALVCAAAFWFFVSARTNFKKSPSTDLYETEEELEKL